MTQPLTRLGLVTHGGKQLALDTANRVRAWARANDIEAVDVDVWNDGVRRTGEDEAAAAGHPRLIVTVGGDGTFLRGVRVAAASDADVLGVDVGRVGFLTEVTVDELTDALDAVRDGRVQIEQRLMLTVRASRPFEIPAALDALIRYGRGPALDPPHLRDESDEGWGVSLAVSAVNDIVFEKLARDRQASLGVYVGDRLFASYSADAVIVASPTGSTAYSFSAGGPVVSPRLEALIFTPVAPHMIFNRSLVTAVDEPVAVRVLERSGRVAVSIDGQLRGVLEPGDWVAVLASGRRARLVRLRPSDFWGRLRDRFGLADAAAATADGSSPEILSPAAPRPPELQGLYLPNSPA